MKKLLYYTIALLPVGAIAQQKDSTSDAMTIDIIITQDGETQRVLESQCGPY
ncbi:MAG: hypothetical protein U5L96_07505 [Owenweeksia sp.]|nr:hypothetical protein [Owenweeksia sp.]